MLAWGQENAHKQGKKSRGHSRSRNALRSMEAKSAKCEDGLGRDEDIYKKAITMRQVFSSSIVVTPSVETPRSKDITGRGMRKSWTISFGTWSTTLLHSSYSMKRKRQIKPLCIFMTLMLVSGTGNMLK
ncbi:hypothetical protein Patl1_07474 [Pistacia atlantica]|uniref:Uncharacterized protein n=1 Tax=Pistacia atlantica TaxID=434234 RepID=A0ACC1ALA5_9ROSI|nr:hypothetical protein Patl1_07474 [Pistacia atlantica]